MRKILIANRGEVAVRIARACRDSGLASAAVYADADADAPHVRLADEAFALGGDRAPARYLDIEAVLDCCRRSGADAVHPGWGYLAENADFAQAVLAAGLTWIGPPPAVIRRLADKVAARQLARQVGAPLAAGSPGPVGSAAEVVDFARRHGLPVAIKAAAGGGGRGLRVARTLAEIPDRYDAAVREAVAAFGRGDCFVERYLARPRHVETQCLADRHGTVLVVSTRDCSLQRRHQKLVEEAPAPFLTAEQNTTLVETSTAILAAAGYVGAGTCEFLIGADGTVSFLEVNTRLQVEHPVSEEVTGLDLVQEMFRIAAGDRLDHTAPQPRGHAIEFRINGEDPGRNFLPAPGTVTRWRPPAGPGVRVDAGVEAGTVVGPAFDSLLAKLIVTGRDRRHALARARRALAEFDVDGLPTTLPFHRAVVDDPAFAPAAGPFGVHTQWIETEFAAALPAAPEPADPAAPAAAPARETIVLEVNRRRVEVLVPAGLAMTPPAGTGPPTGTPTGPAGQRVVRRRPGRAAAPVPAAGAVVSPMQGTVVAVPVADGQRVAAGELLLVLEAMKLEQPLHAHRPGTVTGLTATPGTPVSRGTVLCTLAD